MLFGRQGVGSDYERLIVVQRPAVGLRAIVAVHSTRRGPAFGGIRRRRYDHEAAALDDALALAEAMSHKCALAGLAAGGAKTVVLMSESPPKPSVEWSRAYEALGEEIAALRGDYVCGPDVGTGPAQLRAVRRVCSHVNPEGNDAGASTAAGVHAGLRAIWRALDFAPGQPRTVAIQGLGAVGEALARALRAQGVRVIGADLDPRACRAAAQHGVEIVEPDALPEQACDVLVPCAMGGGLDEATIDRLRCRAVCGSANNQLATPADTRRLHARGIVHAPDIVVSAGAVIEGVLTVREGTGAAVRTRVAEAIEAIEATLGEVLAEAARCGRPPTEVARSMAAARLGATPSSDR
ncbi:MAG: Glu/Leu/Phe/Val dehydrogenase dimerization domain-containing protein [Myxococcota bacterium]